MFRSFTKKKILTLFFSNKDLRWSREEKRRTNNWKKIPQSEAADQPGNKNLAEQRQRIQEKPEPTTRVIVHSHIADVEIKKERRPVDTTTRTYHGETSKSTIVEIE